ncbi:hypothetical protein MVEN_02489800 [Mycena venus]|uniref:GATA-type domain-containing protein n=1 Tax=Mycena venus TaxID=2733690 RepID=A0A8H7CAI0_9AGAR|nr:hypothetical protein MVEN_02489800 [Mycena venus]
MSLRSMRGDRPGYAALRRLQQSSAVLSCPGLSPRIADVVPYLLLPQIGLFSPPTSSSSTSILFSQNTLAQRHKNSSENPSSLSSIPTSSLQHNRTSEMFSRAAPSMAVLLGKSFFFVLRALVCVRFSRLSRIRRELGYQGPLAPWGDADKIALDSNYMAVDIVINWAAEGVVLCFIHAIVDLTPRDNDEAQKSGWCGTPPLDNEQIELLFRRLLVCIPQLSNMNRVFQILANEPNNRRLMISWPPDQGQGPASRDFSKLVEDVQIGPGAPTGNEAKTSCTRRYKALQSMPAVPGEVESIFIPHGSVIFACHKVNSPSRGTATTPATNNMQQIAYSTPELQRADTLLRPTWSFLRTPSSLSPHSPPTIIWHNQRSPRRLSRPLILLPAGPSLKASSHRARTVASGPRPHPKGTLLVISAPGPIPPPQGQQWPSQPPSYIETTNTSGPTYQRPLSPAYGYTSPTTDEATSPATDVVPPPRRRVSPGSRESGGSSGRNGGTRPAGVLRCSSCKTTTSPEWRKGPSGKKELCNACGLRYARSRAKKEGNQAQRKRKEKGAVVKRGTSATPPSATSSTGSYSAIRRKYDDSSFSSAGSASGSDVYPKLEDSTPSPSPPASNMNFVHYSPGDNHSHYQAAGSNSFYSIPSPLSNPPVQPSQSYPDRASPMHSARRTFSAYVHRAVFRA